MRRPHTLTTVVPATLAALVLSILPTAAQADPGSRDRSFGERGERVVDRSTSAELVRISGRRIVTATADRGRLRLQMFTSGGDRVTDFGRGGTVRLGSTETQPRIALAWMPEREWIIVQSPRRAGARSEFTALRPDGSLATRFGDGGVARPPGGATPVVTDIAVQGRQIVVLGSEGSTGNNPIVRLTPDGQRYDESFNGGTGMLTLSGPGLDLDQVIAHGDDLYVSGASDEGLEVFKLTEDGEPSVGWATAGNATWTPPSPDGSRVEYLTGFIDVRDGTGAVAVMGTVQTYTVDRPYIPATSGAVGALTSGGVLDDTFDNRLVPGFYPRGPLVSLASGKTLAAGVTWTVDSGGRAASVARFTADGAFDDEFGRDGVHRNREASLFFSPLRTSNTRSLLLPPARGTIVSLEQVFRRDEYRAVLVGLQG